MALLVNPFTFRVNLHLSYKSLLETLVCGYSNESYYACAHVLSVRDTVYYAVQCGSDYKACGQNPKGVITQMKTTKPYFHVALFIRPHSLTLKFVNKILLCGHSTN